MSGDEAKNLYFDESHFTGYNYLDKDQPFFTVSSSDIEDKEAERILKDSFPKYGANEFKFTKVWKDRAKRDIRPFVQNIKSLSDRTYTYVIDKKFAVLTKAVDFLVEPVVRDQGYDWYKNGYCWKYVNLMHFALHNFCSPEVYESIIRIYHEFSNEPTQESLGRMQYAYSLMANSIESEAKDFVRQLALGAVLFNEYHDISTFRKTGEIQVTTMVSHVAYWRQKCVDDFIVIHDKSSNFYRQRDIWEKIVGPDAPSQLHPLGNGTFVQYPLRVVSTVGVDSEESYAIQLCDLLAGLKRTLLVEKYNDNDRRIVDGLIADGAHDLPFNGICFSPQFPDGPPEASNGPDAVDLMTKNIFR